MKKLFLILFLLFSQTALAQEQNQNQDAVFVFNKICYSQVPNLAAIETMAEKLAWHPLENDELEQFKPKQQRAEKLIGWNVQVGEKLYKVAVLQSALSKTMQKTFPAFANGTAISCSMILDEQTNAKNFLPNMEKLAGKQPTQKNIIEGDLLSTMWSGGNENYKVFLFAKTPKNNKGGLLNVLLLNKGNS